MKVDVRTKVIISVVFSTLALIYQKPAALCALLICSVLMLAVFQVHVQMYKKTLLYLFNIYTILIVLQSVFVRNGSIILSFNSIPILTTDGILYGISIVLRFLIFITSGLLLTSSPASELVSALVYFKIPYEIVFMVQLAIRFIPMLIGEMQNTVQIIQLRGVDLRKVYKRKIIKVYFGIFLPLLYSIWKKAEKIAVLLEIRSFRKFKTRTYYREISFRVRDYLVLAILLLFVVAFVGITGSLK